MLASVGGPQSSYDAGVPEVTYLNRGMYDIVEAARLVGVSPGTIVRWSDRTSSRPALVIPSLGGLYSFHDLISLNVVAQLARRRVPLVDIAVGIRTLADDLQTATPLAHRELESRIATVGRRFFARPPTEAEWIDAGQGGQRAFQTIVEPALRQLEYGPDHLASIWRPHERVWLNPRVQAGASCIDRTRIPTATMLQIVESGDDVHDVAGDYDIDLEDVIAALQFERSLERAAA